MKNTLYVLVLLISASSCIQEMDIEESNDERRVVVSCLFSVDESWDVVLSTTKYISDNEDFFIDDASVFLYTKEGDTIVLESQGKGHYCSSLLPVAGVGYRLEVNAPAFERVTAYSSIPPLASFEVADFQVIWTKYMYPNDLMDYDVFPLEVLLPEPADGYSLFRALLFSPDYGYKRYLLSSRSLEELGNEGIPAKGLERLSKLIDEWHYSPEVFTDCLEGLGDHLEINFYYNLIRDKLQQKTVARREYRAFAPLFCFSGDDWLANISYDNKIVLGINNYNTSAKLLYGDTNLFENMKRGNTQGKEYWLEVGNCSLDYYKYYRTYILQLSQRINPYSEPVVAYSNIQNGLGIFAGYQRQMIHLFNY